MKFLKITKGLSQKSIEAINKHNNIAMELLVKSEVSKQLKTLKAEYKSNFKPLKSLNLSNETKKILDL